MLNEERITYRMINLIESGFFGKDKILLNEALADTAKIRIFQAAYNYTYNQNIGVDGVRGTQTNTAIDEVKKAITKEKLDDTAMKDFYTKFFEKLVQDSTNINVGQGGANTNKNLNYAIQTLINLAGKPLGIDSVIGTKTNTAIKELTGSDTITKDNVQPIIEKAKANINELGVEGIATVQGNAAAKDGSAKGKVGKYGTCLKGDCENGQGTLLNNNDGGNNNTYIGTFVNGKLTGEKNRIEYKNGDIFEGKTLNGYPANGKYFNEQIKDVFEGTFYEGTKDFKFGTYKSFEGWTYIGGYNNNKMEGIGSTYINKNGQKFVGDFKASVPVGATWDELDAGKATAAFKMTQADDVSFDNDMQKFKSVIDKKIADGTITGKGDIFSGTFNKIENGLQILDSNSKLLYTTKSIPTKLTETQGRWSYYTGGGGQKLMNFGTMNSMSKYIYNYPTPAKNNKATTANTPPTKSSPETLSKFNTDMKKLLGIIKDYTQKWGFFYKQGGTIAFYDNIDNKKIFTSSVIPEILTLQGGWWVYNNNKIEFKSKNANKVEYTFTIS